MEALEWIVSLAQEYLVKYMHLPNIYSRLVISSRYLLGFVDQFPDFKPPTSFDEFALPTRNGKWK